jgi:ArsR family transcriptional regulator
MKILVESGIVVARKSGKWTYYSISEKGGKNAAKLLTQLTNPQLNENIGTTLPKNFK